MVSMPKLLNGKALSGFMSFDMNKIMSTDKIRL